jgi:alcohol dehydrogenase YqhD (iron-dependent ADH family)
MVNFNYLNSTRIIFGKDTHKQIGEILKEYNKVLIVYGGGSIKKIGLYDDVINSITAEGIEYTEIAGVKSNPSIALVREGTKTCKTDKVDCILAVGGGSVIDTAKAIALGSCYEGDVWDFFAEWIEPENVLPVYCILTVPAAGSESSAGTVISNEETKEKILYGSEKIMPKVSIVNPELFYSVPEKQLAAGACDMMSHAMERYFTSEKHVELTDGFCEAGLKTIMRNILRIMAKKDDYDAWCDMTLAGNMVHNGVCGVGRISDWSCHMIEHEISALYDVIHGEGLAVLTPAWMKYVYKNNLNIFAQFAVNVMHSNIEIKDIEELALDGINKLENFFAKLGLPKTLGDIGIHDRCQYEEIAKRATHYNDMPDYRLGSLQKLSWNDVVEILKLAEK